MRRTINEPTYGFNRCYSIRVGSNNIYVAAEAGDGPYYYVLYKFDLDGNSIFNNYYLADGIFIVPRDVAVDSNGDVIMVGGGGLGWYIIKCNSDGDTLWTRTIQGYGFLDQARAVLIDNSNDIIVSGSVNRIVKYDTNGNLIYNNTLGGDTNWQFYSLIKYDNNNAIGIGNHQRSSGNSFDLLLGKYSIETGDSVWTDIWIHPDQNVGLTGYDGAVFFDSSLVVLGQTVDATGTYLVIYLMSFALADTPLSVELTSFNASINRDGNIKLDWLTATETNNQGFEIERKTNDEWEKIGYLAGFGTTTEPKAYSFTDNDITTGTYTYRLKQIDFDGTYEYSSVVEVEVDFNPKEYTLYQNYPNPFNPSTTIKYSLPFASNVKIIVYNMLGKTVSELINKVQESGYYEVNWNAGNNASGIYFYKIEAKSTDGKNNYTSVKKMLMVK